MKAIMEDIIKLNVGGVMYTTTRPTLTRGYPDSMLASMFSERIPTSKDTDGNYFIDGNGHLFRYVLDFLRRSELTLPSDFKEHDMLEKEADYYQIPELMKAVQEHRHHDNKEEEMNVEFIVLEFDNTAHSGYTVNDFVRIKIYGSFDVLRLLKHKLETLSDLIGSLSPKSGVSNLDVSDIQLKRYLPQAPIMRELLMLGFRMYTMPEHKVNDPVKEHLWFKREIPASKQPPRFIPPKHKFLVVGEDPRWAEDAI